MGDMKRTWNILQDLLGTQKKGKQNIKEILYEGNIVQDKKCDCPNL